GRPISPSRFLLLSLAQNAVLFCIVIALGLLAARAVGLGAPYVEAALGGPAPERSAGEMLVWSLGLGGAGGALLLAIDLVLIPHLPALLALARKTSLWENVTASFYGGVNEELLFRLLGLSGIAWLLSRVWRTPLGHPTDAALWSANLITAALFGLGHLPAVLTITGSITPLLVGRTLVLNVPIGLICGWLFCRFGIEAAIATHFTADIVYHVGGTLLLRANDQFGVLPWFPRAGP
ncbi:MAG: CPBP family intramembrane metalloprotease, partial [Xanthobacteraceae bacterium]|nr:CPBP family intramembrane metalloprotease [Xanthobacteraceae bacterium]